MNENVRPLSSVDVDWIGVVPPSEYMLYLDTGLLLILGGIPWQVRLALNLKRSKSDFVSNHFKALFLFLFFKFIYI